jgi:hypothetical protein
VDGGCTLIPDISMPVVGTQTSEIYGHPNALRTAYLRGEFSIFED